MANINISIYTYVLVNVPLDLWSWVFNKSLETSDDILLQQLAEAYWTSIESRFGKPCCCSSEDSWGNSLLSWSGTIANCSVVFELVISIMGKVLNSALYSIKTLK